MNWQYCPKCSSTEEPDIESEIRLNITLEGTEEDTVTMQEQINVYKYTCPSCGYEVTEAIEYECEEDEE